MNEVKEIEVVLDRADSCAKTQVDEPELYDVVVLNDDYTPALYVVCVLEKVFRLGRPRAHAVMTEAHFRGSAVVCRGCPHDIAETKISMAAKLAASDGHPLRFIMFGPNP
jgi:ATP-dependent Clp protease adaptor protein ClpS